MTQLCVQCRNLTFYIFKGLFALLTTRLLRFTQLQFLVFFFSLRLWLNFILHHNFHDLIEWLFLQRFKAVQFIFLKIWLLKLFLEIFAEWGKHWLCLNQAAFLCLFCTKFRKFQNILQWIGPFSFLLGVFIL